MLDSLLVFLGLMIGLTTVARVIVRAIDAKTKRRQTAIPSDLETRIGRIEQIVEATAIEVERISEGQRFTTKLLAEQSAPKQPVAQLQNPQ